MLKIDEKRQIIAKGLKTYLQHSVIRANQTGDIPKYPYTSYNITTPMSENNGTWEVHNGFRRKLVKQTWSITVQSDNEIEAMELAIKARNWFEEVGRIYLTDNDITVQSVGNITPRNNLITIEYEYRNGFDVVFYMYDEIVEDYIDDYIESVELGNMVIDTDLTNDELNEMLERRLSGD